jgi:GT2 family glycosyltransferase
MERLKGLSFLVPTLNNLPYLELCISSFKDYSLKDTELCVFASNPSPQEIEFLEQSEITYGIGERKGVIHGFNMAAKLATKEYLLFGAGDDIVFAPNWDFNLRRHLRPDWHLTPRLVEPSNGSFPPPYDCGKDISSFNKAKFLKYAASISQEALIPHLFEWGAISTDLFWSVGGFDIDLGCFSITDLQLRLMAEEPSLEFYQLNNSIIYHFQSVVAKRENLWSNLKARTDGERFAKKWGFSASEAHERFHERVKRQ